MMKFKWNIEKIETNKVEEWMKIRNKLEEDLAELAAGKVSEEEARSYLTELTKVLRIVEHGDGEVMRFLAFDAPNSLEKDARIDFLHRPTHIAAAIMMTALNRFESLGKENGFYFSSILHDVLNATIATDFRGHGCDGARGLLDTLDVFAAGDTMVFIQKYPKLNGRFTAKLRNTILYVKKEFCTGNVKDGWSDKDYSERAEQVLAKLQGNTASA